TSGEREKIIKRIFELQIEENGVFVEKAKIELEQIKGRTPSNLLGKFMNAFGTTILFLLIWAKAGNASNNAFFPNSVMSDWITGGVIIAGAMGLSWLWNKLTWFKSTEQRTVQLVDRAVREYERVKHNVNLIKMEKFYANSSFKDQRVIIDTIRERIRLNPDKINASIFEPFFMNILKFGPKNVLQNPQSSASEQWKIKSPDSLKAPAAAMNSSIKGALKIYNERYFSRHNIDIKAVSFELSRLVLNLTLRNTLHERTVFVKHLQGNAALTKYINADQAEKLYTIIVDEMPVTLKSKDDIMLKIIEKELAKLRGEINAAKAASEITPFLTQIISSLGDTGRTKIILRFMLSSSPALWKSIIEKGQWDGFFTSLNEKLINGVAKQVAFSDSYAVIKREIKRRGLDDIDADEEVYEMFYRAIEAETEGLRFAALSSLEDLSRTESGTNRLVESLEEYLRTEGSNISMDLEKKIIAVVEKLTEEKNKMKAAGINITSEPVRNQDELLPKTVESKRETVIAADTKNATAETAPKIEINKAYLKSMFMNVNMIGYAI
ncbi:MAG: hypothetical protein L6416_04765, partial [Candidatus Omnitrophica bacterium]|nr:hypothetical protein [Candidatus Omnitrophota bacterium]